MTGKFVTPGGHDNVGLLSILDVHRDNQRLHFHPRGRVAKGLFSCGTHELNLRSKPEKSDLVALQEAIDYFPELLDANGELKYVAPRVDPESERDSIICHGNMVRDVTKLTPYTATDEQIVGICEHYPPTKFPNFAKSSVLTEEFNCAVASVQRKASAGALTFLGGTKGQCLDTHLDYIFHVILARFIKFQTTPREEFNSLDPQECFERGLSDAVRNFLKREPTKKEKAREGRWRIIQLVAIIDEVFHRMLLHRQNEADIKNAELTPSSIGLGLSSDIAGAKIVNSKVTHPSLARSKRGFVCTDNTAWDWNVPRSLWLIEAKCRSVLSGQRDHLLFEKVIEVLMRPVFVIGTGEMFLREFPGGMVTGSYFTSCSNSRLQYISTSLNPNVGLHWPVNTMGDDRALLDLRDGKDTIEAMLAWEAERGPIVKEDDILITDPADPALGYDFCSHYLRRTEDGDFVWEHGKPLRCITRWVLNPKKDLTTYIGECIALRHSPYLMRFADYVSEKFPDIISGVGDLSGLNDAWLEHCAESVELADY